ncbi:MAG: hypothetical protein AB1726_18835 [Planctomycetota bacterium]
MAEIEFDGSSGPGAGNRWWDQFHLRPGTTGHWRVGPLRLWIRRDPRELWVARETAPEGEEDVLAVEIPARAPAGSRASVTRYAVREGHDIFRLEPALADRPVVVDAEHAFFVPPGEEAILYLSAPLWYRLRVAQTGAILEDVPLRRPSDTWFGPTTLTGELCYAMTTSAQLDLESLPPRPHCAVSAVQVHNGGTERLLLEKMKLPAPNLSLFATPAGLLWTETLHVRHEEDDQPATVRLGGGPPAAAGPAEPIAGPRQGLRKGIVVEALGTLFGRQPG